MQPDYIYLRPRNLLAIEKRGPYHKSTGAAWDALLSWLDSTQARRDQVSGYGIAWDSPRHVAPDRLRYSAGVEPAGELAEDPANAVLSVRLPGGTYAVHRHKGPYAEKAGKFSQLHREWAPAQGLAVDYTRPFIEIYLNDPGFTPDTDLRVDLCVPIIVK
jgi:AraC family transcriptional regulator